VNYSPASLAKNFNRELTNVLVGGGFVESFAFGGSWKSLDVQGSNQASFAEIRSAPTPFSLGHAVGISSAQFADEASMYGFSQILNPRISYAGIADGNLEQQATRLFQFGDGGTLENTGVVAMVQSGANKLVSLINTWAPLANTSDLDLCNIPPGTDLSRPTSGAASSDLGALFGFATGAAVNEYIANNHIFASEQYGPLLCKLQTLRDAGRPAIVAQNLTTVNNTWWNIPAGRDVEILCVYLERIADFTDQLPEDTRAEIAKGDQGTLRNYPFFDTLLQNPPELIALTMSQANLLGSHFEFAVTQTADLFKGFLAP